LDGALAAFGLSPDHELEVMTHAQTLPGTVARILDRLPSLLNDLRAAAVLVQGDTTTALAAALASFFTKIPLGHVEAGLRTYDFENPFPEEANRQLVDRISTWCFAPTQAARDNLISERIPADRVHVTGNTGIDALLWALERLAPAATADQYILMTLHRRESFGPPLRDVLGGLIDFLATVPEASVVWPVHPNPAVQATAREVLAGNGRVRMIPPQEYLTFAGHMAKCRFILTDSGGIQEEAPSLGKRVLIARETTERPEAVRTGQNRVIGRDRKRVSEELWRAWHEPSFTGTVPAPNPYGDGQASARVVDVLQRELVR
jgi:UDP-N-acetylglucosamine 2-epimerase (non-hydrolysing)